MFSWSKLLVTSVFMLFLLQVAIPWTSASNDGLITVSLTEAEEALATSYETVLAAEQAGANVSALFEQFNVGCEYLAQAHIWHRVGNPENTSYFAGLCYDVAENLQSNASELRNEAKRVAEDSFVTTTFVSIGSIIVIIVLSFVFWRIFERHLYRKIHVTKPEAVVDES